MTEISKEDILELIAHLKPPESPTLSQEEFAVLKEIIQDRQAMSRVFSWLLYAIGSIATIIVGWAAISGALFDWIKDHIK